jgi:GTP-binding protein EngB required for normal cell division
MRCKENIEGSDNTDAKFIYTHTFNNWINKKESNENYYRKKYSFLVEDKQRMGFILTKPDKEKDEEDRLQEERIRSKVKERTEEQWYNEDKDFKK